MAEVLLTRNHGRRPITLIGFSLGARVIYHCLLTMSKRSNYEGESELFTKNSVPAAFQVSLKTSCCWELPLARRPTNGARSARWSVDESLTAIAIPTGFCGMPTRSGVSGNTSCFRFLYRTMSVQFTIAGTGPIDCKERKIKNFNLSHIVSTACSLRWRSIATTLSSP